MRTNATLVALGLAVSLIGGASSGSAQAYVRVGTFDPSSGFPTQLEVPPHTGFTLPVHVDRPRDLAALTFKLSWDPTAFTYESAAPGSFGQVTVNDAAAATGELFVSLFSVNGTSTSFDVIELQFTSGTHGGGFLLDVLTAGDETGQDITAQVLAVDLNLCVGLLGLRGDVTSDDAVNIIDAQQVARFSVGLPTSNPERMPRLGDVTLDSGANIVDAQQIARFSVFLPAVPSIAEPVAGCWSEIACFGFPSYHEVVVLDSESLTGVPDYSVATVDGLPAQVRLRSTVPWLTLPVTEGQGQFSGVATLYGDPRLPPHASITAWLTPTSPSAWGTLPCFATIIVLHPSLFTIQDSIVLVRGAGDPATETIDVPVWVNATGGGIREEFDARTDPTASWLSASLVEMPRSSGQEGRLVVATTPAGLSPGRYRADVTLFSPRYVGIPEYVLPVVLDVVGPTASLDFAAATSAYAEVPDAAALDLTTEWTIELWVKPERVSGATQHLVSKWGGAGDASYEIDITNGKFRVGIHDGASPTQWLETHSDAVAGQWQHVAATLSGGQLQLFVGGAWDRSRGSSLIPMVTAKPLSFGREGAPFNGWFYDGLMADVRIWNVARSEAEIAASMNTRLTGSEAGLVASWSLDEGFGDVMNDASSHGLHGRLGSAVGPDANDPAWRTTGGPPIR